MSSIENFSKYLVGDENFAKNDVDTAVLLLYSGFDEAFHYFIPASGVRTPPASGVYIPEGVYVLRRTAVYIFRQPVYIFRQAVYVLRRQAVYIFR